MFDSKLPIRKKNYFMITQIKITIILFLFVFLPLFGLNKVTVKVYHVFESFGTETQELKHSTVINYDKRGLVIDSTIYSHDIPLSKKYVYVTGENEGLQLQRTYDKEVVLSYKFEYDNLKRKTSTSLFGPNDSTYWKEHYKYDNNNYLYKVIRFDPNKALNPEMIDDVESGEMVWAEKYIYFENENGAKELWESLKKCCDLNVQRNQLIDEIDEKVVEIIESKLKGEDLDSGKFIQRKHKTY